MFQRIHGRSKSTDTIAIQADEQKDFSKLLRAASACLFLGGFLFLSGIFTGIMFFFFLDATAYGVGMSYFPVALTAGSAAQVLVGAGLFIGGIGIRRSKAWAYKPVVGVIAVSMATVAANAIASVTTFLRTAASFRTAPGEVIGVVLWAVLFVASVIWLLALPLRYFLAPQVRKLLNTS
jgi:hypothetical protein